MSFTHCLLLDVNRVRWNWFGFLWYTNGILLFIHTIFLSTIVIIKYLVFYPFCSLEIESRHAYYITTCTYVYCYIVAYS